MRFHWPLAENSSIDLKRPFTVAYGWSIRTLLSVSNMARCSLLEWDLKTTAVKPSGFLYNRSTLLPYHMGINTE